MKMWRLIVTSADGKGTGETFQNRWEAEQAYEMAREPGKLVTLAEFYGNRQIEVVRDNRFEVERKS